MGFLKTAFFALLALTAGVASARPMSAAAPAPAPAVFGGDCSSLGPYKMVQCCVDKILDNIHDASCDNSAHSPSPAPVPHPSPSPTPMPGSDCASTGPANLAGCCALKAKKGETDPTCPEPSPSPSPGVGYTCASTGPDNLAGCCAEKAKKGETDPTCPEPSPSPPPAPVVGASCGVTSPGHRSDCCAQKQKDHIADDYCTAMGASCEHVPSATGTTSGTSAVGPDGKTSFTPVPIMTSAECCAEKKREKITDTWCTPPAPAPAPTPAVPAVPMCPCPTAPGPDVNRTNVPATSEFAQFTFPAYAWSDALNVTADFPGDKFVGCDGAVVTRNNSESIEDCQRYTTSLRFAPALIWDPATKICQPYASSAVTATPTPVDASKVYPQLSHWTLDTIPVNVTIPGACAKNATVFTA